MIKKLNLYILSLCLNTPVFAQEYSLLMTGDTMLGSKEGMLTAKLFGDVLPDLLQQHDFKLFNLEGTLGVVGIDDKSPKCYGGKYCYTFMTPYKALDLFHMLQGSSNLALNLANNHSMDYGHKVQENTYRAIKKSGLGTFGSLGYPVERYQIGTAKFAFIGASPHRNTLSIFGNDLKNYVAALKKENYIVVVSLHMGSEGEHAYVVRNHDEIFLGQNRGNIYQLAHQLVDYGADVIVGHGPHVMRGIEVYKDKLIAYSLGNFLTYGSFSLTGSQAYGGLLNIRIDKKGNFVGGKFIGTQQLKSVEPQQWANGIAIKKSFKSTYWLKLISYSNFPLTTVKIDNQGNLSP